MEDKKKFKCDIGNCTAAFARSSSLKNHKDFVHLNLRPFKCSIQGCKSTYKSARALKKHIHAHNKIHPYKCTFENCTSAFPRLERLKSHMLSHSDVRAFLCGIKGCKSTFKSSCSLRRHQRIHRDKLYKCDFADCTSTFTRADSLAAHKSIHFDIRSFVCPFEGCNMTFKNNSGLANHKNVHSTHRPFLCQYPGCGATFRTFVIFTQHKRIHINDRPFHCSIDGCSSTFNDKSHLWLHEKKHLGIKNHKCNHDGCGLAFILPSELKRHEYYWHTKEGQVKKKKDEARILSLLEKNDFNFKAQHHIDFTCIGYDRDGDRCYIDFLLEVKDVENKTIGFIMLEVDEHQHEWYDSSCETRRMADVQRTLMLEGNTFPIVFVRYNPHAYKVDSIEKKLNKKDREEQLVQYLRNISFDKPFSVVYMFYDVVDELPYIFTDPNYPDAFKTMVGECVF